MQVVTSPYMKSDAVRLNHFVAMFPFVNSPHAADDVADPPLLPILLTLVLIDSVHYYAGQSIVTMGGKSSTASSKSSGEPPPASIMVCREESVCITCTGGRTLDLGLVCAVEMRK